jgi:ribonuclease HII
VRALRRRLDASARARRRESRRLGRLLLLESALWDVGVERIAGVDEAGMGPLAGPVVAAAVILCPGQRIRGLDDSKRLAPLERERLAAEVRESAVAVSVGSASVAEIAELDVHQAGLLAMKRAVLGLRPRPQHLLVDARTVPGVDVPQDAHVKGDARSLSIAAASVVAKTDRDARMARLAQEHPGYGFERHQGYATAEHLEALRRLGPCPQHRTSWAALGEHAGEWSQAYYRLRDGLRPIDDEEGFERWRREAARLAGRLRPDELARLERLAGRKAGAVTRAARTALAPRLPLD